LQKNGIKAEPDSDSEIEGIPPLRNVCKEMKKEKPCELLAVSTVKNEVKVSSLSYVICIGKWQLDDDILTYTPLYGITSGVIISVVIFNAIVRNLINWYFS
jgi:hypothetical protein